ncbi:cyclic nucleotide-binding protein [Oscillatoriales cyanobacterium USR001]|nr:cyclic nucleotide-binding protein [Oscillatoriales cyanobacterium USR001]
MDLASHRFISYFDQEQADQLCQVAEVESFPQEQVVFEEGEIPDFLYLVLAGQVEFSKRTASGKYQTVAVAKPNDFFGEFGVLDGQPRSARAVVCQNSTLAKISRDTLMDTLRISKGSAVLHLFGYITQHLRSTTDQYVKQLVHKEKMVVVGEMVSTIIHDFKSPFTGIQLSSEMLKELHPDEETTEWCDLIQLQVQRMLGMADEVLEFSRGNATLNKKNINLSQTLQQFERLNRVYFDSASVELVVQTGDVIIEADENKILRVLQNLVGNAVEAFDGKGGKIEIKLETEGKWAKIIISDNGPGIPESIREHLFDAFVTFGKRSGTGLGTAIAKSIIDAHGGNISFDSQYSQGTTFYLRLPRLITE